MTNFVPFSNMNKALHVSSIKSARSEIMFITPLVEIFWWNISYFWGSYQ